MEIRTLGPEDIDLMRGMLALFGQVFHEPETYTGSQPTTPYLRRLLASDEFIALAAVEDGTVLGGLAAYELHKFEQERSEIYIYDLGVAEERRREGIASGLIARTREIAAERSAWVVLVQADEGDAPAIALYAKFGEREDIHHFDIPVTRRA